MQTQPTFADQYPLEKSLHALLELIGIRDLPSLVQDSSAATSLRYATEDLAKAFGWAAGLRPFDPPNRLQQFVSAMSAARSRADAVVAFAAFPELHYLVDSPFFDGNEIAAIRQASLS